VRHHNRRTVGQRDDADRTGLRFLKNTTPGEAYSLSYLMVTYVSSAIGRRRPLEEDNDEATHVYQDRRRLDRRGV